MKKFLLSVFSAILTVTAVDAQTVPRTPFIEHFTQASCGPCASQNPTMYNTLNTFGTANYVKMTYQTSWPGVDPMNAAYPAGPQARVTYYGVNGVPDASLNGGTTAAPNTAVTSSTLSAAAAQTTAYDLDVTQAWNSTTNAFDVTVTVTNVSAAAISSMDRLHVGMVENQITYSSAPGSNGETDFFYVLRQFYDATTGMASNAPATIGSIPANGNMVYTFSVSNYPGYLNDLEQVSFVAFLQNNSSKVVEQAAKSTPSVIPGLLLASATANTTVGAGYCDYMFTPAVNFTSNNATPITSVTAEYTINGGTPVPVTVNGLSLMSGQSTAITFPVATLASGSSTVQYAITDINSGGTYSPGSVFMDAEGYSKLPSTSSPTPLAEGFQGLAIGAPGPASGVLADNPNAVRAFAVNQGISAAVTWNLGGHGASDGCFRWDYYGISNGGTSKLVWEKLDLTNEINTRLSFSRAHALYGGNEPDRLKVNVSTDCGATWTTVWDKQGTQLATAPAVGNARFYPSVAQWVTDTIDLTAYDGATELVVAFEGISGFGNCLYLDDVNTFEGTAVGVSTINVEAAEVRIMPNPVSNNMTLEFTMLNTADANINIVNALGQQVQQVINGSFSGTNVVEVNTSNLAAGVYFVNITTKEGTTTERFIRQ